MSESVQEKRLPILVTGGNGMLGYYFSGKRFFKPSRHELDLCAPATLTHTFKTQNFSAVLHLAAMTDLDLCEKNPQLAWEINAQGTQFLAKICAQKNIPLVYLSTAGIFGGFEQTAFSEQDPPNPISTYAKSKFDGERAVLQYSPKHYIIRIGWLMGGCHKDHKFVGTLSRMMKTSQAAPRQIPIVTDTLGSLLYGKDLAGPLWQMLRKQVPYGIYHLSNAGTCSRMDLAQALRDMRGFEKHHVELIPTLSKTFQHEIPRPRCEVLTSKKLLQLGFPALRHWRDALADYLCEWPL